MTDTDRIDWLTMMIEDLSIELRRAPPASVEILFNGRVIAASALTLREAIDQAAGAEA
jgi:hypothetical protein